MAIGLYVLYWGLIYHGQGRHLGLHGRYRRSLLQRRICPLGLRALLAPCQFDRRVSGATGRHLCDSGLSPVQQAFGLDIPSARVGLISIAATTLVMLFGSLLFPDRKANDGQTLTTNTGDA